MPSKSVWKSHSVVLWSFTVSWFCCRSVAQQDYEALKERFSEGMASESLMRRTEARVALASTGDPRAFAVLFEHYRHPEEASEFVGSLVISIMSDHFNGARHIELWRDAREQSRRASDAWLWHQSLLRERRQLAEDWGPVVVKAPNPWLSAAALRSVADSPGPRSKADGHHQALLDALKRVPTQEPEVSLVLEAAFATYEAAAPNLAERSRSELRHLIARLTERPRSKRTMHVVARSLGRATSTPNIGPDMADWLEVLESASVAERNSVPRKAGGGSATQFFGLREHATRICYVMDASDSMLEKLSPHEREAIIPITGTRRESSASGSAGLVAERLIDWSKVVTRFDAARELLKQSLRSLGKDQHFAVVLFGSEAKLLSSTQKVVPARAEHVEKACAELDAMEPRPSEEVGRPEVLMGDTNLHAGLVLAFRVTAKGVGSREAHVDPVTFESGVDAIFLLSDGRPNTDSFAGKVRTEEGAGIDIGDPEHPELGVTRDYRGEYWLRGPFKSGAHLVADIKRLNVLRRCAIHAVGLGEADHSLLESIARIGGGTTLQVGQR